MMLSDIEVRPKRLASPTLRPRDLPIAYRIVKPSARLRLFCFPYAGAGASVFRSWANEAPPGLEICPVQLPGRELRHEEVAYSRVEPLVEALCAELGPLLDLPYALFGYSMGALIAFELGRTLSTRSTPPIHLVAAARRAPQRPDRRSPIHHLSDEDFIHEIGKYEGTPTEILQNVEVLQFFLPTLRADFAVCETYNYKPGKPLDCALTVYGASADPDVTQDDLEAWSAETRSACKIHLFAGSHFFIQKSPHLLSNAVIAEVSSYL